MPDAPKAISRHFERNGTLILFRLRSGPVQDAGKMDISQTDQAVGWAQVAPLILARQRAMAERVAAEATPAQGDVAPLRADRVATVTDAGRSRDARTDTNGAEPPQDATPKQPETDAAGLTPAQQELVADLKARDAEVRRHEQAHAAVGGQYASAPSYSYQTGPDGRQYAVGGAVQIDVSPVDGDPAATITKMEVVQAAALAPAEPSAADRQVAALAATLRAQAIADLAALRAQERTGGVDRLA